MAAVAEKITRGGYEGTRNEKQPVNVGKKERNLSTAAGALLIAHGLMKRSKVGVLEALAGAGLVYRGTTGFCSLYGALGVDRSSDSEHQRGGIRVQRSVMVNRDPQTVYAFWRQLENLPRFMGHLESVTIQSETRSHWVAKAPGGRTVEWDADITDDVPGHHIAWKSVEGATVPNSGAIGFISADNGKATEVKVSLRYDPPGGMLTSKVASLFGEEPSQQIADDLQRFKEVMESTAAGFPSVASQRPVAH